MDCAPATLLLQDRLADCPDGNLTSKTFKDVSNPNRDLRDALIIRRLHQRRGEDGEAAMFPLSHMLKSFVRIGTLKVIDADGQSHAFVGAPGPRVTMRLTDRSLYHKLFLNPELHAGEAYMDGRMRFEDSTLRDFLTLFSINRLSLGSYPLQKVLRAVSRGLRRFQQANPVGKAQKNVAHHYDLGNDFYKLFLDEGMNYSCAYFLDDDETLEQAQRNKLRLIAAKLHLKPGLRILDIGSGWGDLAFYLAGLEDVDVTGRDVVQRTICTLQ